MSSEVLRSEQINELAKALAAAQQAMKGAKKDADNPFFKSKYADLESVWEACREPLTKNGLSVVQIPVASESGVAVVTVLMHSSGQYIGGTLPLHPKATDPQGIGSAITYGRRYSLAGLAGVYQTDDDGEAAMDREGKHCYVKCADCKRNITGYTKPSGEPVSEGAVLEAGRKRWNLDLCGGCQIGRARKEKEAQAAPPAESKPVAGEVALSDPEIVEMDNDEVAAIGTVTWSKLASGNKPFTFRMGEKMFSCWSATIAAELLKAEKSKKKVEIICVTKKGFTNVEKLIRVGDVPYEELTVQKDEVPF